MISKLTSIDSDTDFDVHLDSFGDFQSVNSPNLKQDQSRNIKPPVYTQQVSYYPMNPMIYKSHYVLKTVPPSLIKFHFAFV